MTCGIFAVTCSADPKVWFVGGSIDVQGRWKDHQGALVAGRHQNQDLQRAWKRHGAAAFAFQILERCSEDQLWDRTRHWREEFVPGQQMKKVARGRKGAPGRHQFKDKDAWRAAISASLQGVNTTPKSEEHRQKIATSLTGKTHSAETKRKMSESQRRRWHGEQ